MKNKTLVAVIAFTLAIAIASCASSRKYGCPSVSKTSTAPAKTVNS